MEDSFKALYEAYENVTYLNFSKQLVFWFAKNYFVSVENFHNEK